MRLLQMTRDAALALAGLALLGGVIFYVLTGPRVVPIYGRDLYMRYCASCHGISGRGDGPAAEALQPRPADLTRLRERYGGQHPLRETMAVIDSRRPVRAHGDSAMPVWGEVFERELEEKLVGWPKATALHQVRLLAEYVLTLQP